MFFHLQFLKDGDIRHPPKMLPGNHPNYLFHFFLSWKTCGLIQFYNHCLNLSLLHEFFWLLQRLITMIGTGLLHSILILFANVSSFEEYSGQEDRQIEKLHLA